MNTMKKCSNAKQCSESLLKIETINQRFLKNAIDKESFIRSNGELFLSLEEKLSTCTNTDCSLCLDLNYYLKCTNMAITDNDIGIKYMLQSYLHAKANDDIIESLPNSTLAIDLKTQVYPQKTCYLDHNLFIQYTKESAHIIPTNLRNSHIFQFVFSITHISEAIAVHDNIKYNEFISKVNSLTNGVMIAVIKEDFKQNIKELFGFFKLQYPYTELEEHAKNYIDMDTNLRQKRLIELDDKIVLDELLDSGVTEREANNYKAIFEKISKEKLQTIAGIYGDANLFLEQNGTSFTSYQEVRNTLVLLTKILDAIPYCKDKNISSGGQDIEHIIYASGCDYFLTSDSKLYNRTKEIFRFLEINTEVILTYPPNSRHWKNHLKE